MSGSGLPIFGIGIPFGISRSRPGSTLYYTHMHARNMQQTNKQTEGDSASSGTSTGKRISWRSDSKLVEVREPPSTAAASRPAMSQSAAAQAYASRATDRHAFESAVHGRLASVGRPLTAPESEAFRRSTQHMHQAVEASRSASRFSVSRLAKRVSGVALSGLRRSSNNKNTSATTSRGSGQ